MALQENKELVMDKILQINNKNIMSISFNYGLEMNYKKNTISQLGAM